jgi:hypothetical protein
MHFGGRKSVFFLRVLLCVRKGRDSAAAFMGCSKTISGAFHYPGNQLDLAAADTVYCCAGYKKNRREGIRGMVRLSSVDSLISNQL